MVVCVVILMTRRQLAYIHVVVIVELLSESALEIGGGDCRFVDGSFEVERLRSTI